MKVDLEKDRTIWIKTALYDRKESPLKKIKERNKEDFREKKFRKLSLNNKQELDIEIVDPLPQELNEYKKEVTYSRITEKSRACENLKKYIISQERKYLHHLHSLKHVRLERIPIDDQTAKASSFTSPNDIKINFIPSRDEDKQLKEINIPKVEDLFRYQTRDKLIHENRKLFKMLGNRHSQIDDAVVKKLKAIDDRGDAAMYFTTINSKEKDLDKIIEEGFERNRVLFDKLENQKKLISKFESGNHSSEELVESLIQLNGVRKKKRETLKGIKSYSVREGDRELKMTPPTMLLYELHKLSGERGTT